MNKEFKIAPGFGLLGQIRVFAILAVVATSTVISLIAIFFPDFLDLPFEQALVMFIISLIVTILLGLFVYYHQKELNRIANERQKLEQERPQSPKRFCPNCNKSIPFDANVCPYCGHKF